MTERAAEKPLDQPDASAARTDDHKFKVGETVRLTRSWLAARGQYRVVKLLPRNAQGHFEYRVKNEIEARIAPEPHLEKVG